VLKLLFSLFLLVGCKEEFPTYVSSCGTEKTHFDCLHYAVLDSQDKQKLEKAFGLKEDNTCLYRVELTKYYVGHCNNFVVKSVGSDFNGYIRIEIKKGFKCYYKVQSDFKDDAVAAFDRVLNSLKMDRNETN